MATVMRQSTMSKDPLLEQEIERNLKLRDGATKILSIAANSLQKLDAEKTILVSNARLMVSMRQLQREKVIEATAAAGSPVKFSSDTSSSSKSGKASLCLSDIRIPLIWRDTSSNFHAANLTPNSTQTLNSLCDISASTPVIGSSVAATLSNLSRPSSLLLMTHGGECNWDPHLDSYTAFCIVQVGGQIEETRLLCDILPGAADIEFEDVLSFDNVSPDFECIIELYAYPRASTRSTFPWNKSSFDGAMTSHRNSAVYGAISPDDPRDSDSSRGTSIMGKITISSCFSLVARFTAHLSDVSDGIIAHTLDTVHHLTGVACCDHHVSSVSRRSSRTGSITESHHGSLFKGGGGIGCFDGSCDIPLFGPICFRLVAHPHSLEKPLHRGLLWIRPLNVAPNQEAALLYTCELKNQCLFARLVEPHQRNSAKATSTECSPIKSNLGTSTVPLRSKFLLGKPQSSANLYSSWDLIIQIDPTMQLMEDTPVIRPMLFSPASLSKEELDFCGVKASKYKSKPSICETLNEAVSQIKLEQESTPAVDASKIPSKKNKQLFDTIVGTLATPSIETEDDHKLDLIPDINQNYAPVETCVEVHLAGEQQLVTIPESPESESPRIESFENSFSIPNYPLSDNVIRGFTVINQYDPKLENGSAYPAATKNYMSKQNSNASDKQEAEDLVSKDLTVQNLDLKEEKRISESVENILKNPHLDKVRIDDPCYSKNKSLILDAKIQSKDSLSSSSYEETMSNVSLGVNTTANSTCVLANSDSVNDGKNISDQVDVDLNSTDDTVSLFSKPLLFSKEVIDEEVEALTPIECILPTFRVASKIVHSGSETISLSSSSSSICDGLNCFEFAAFDPQSFVDNLAEHLDTSVLDVWVSCVHEHLEEQLKWGLCVFDQSVYIPETTSFTKHGSIIRASTMLDNLTSTSDSSPFDEKQINFHHQAIPPNNQKYSIASL